MPSGGYRESSGRKPKYQSDAETTQIRVPLAKRDEARRVIELFDTLWANGIDTNDLTIKQLMECCQKGG
jgi:hypothetical protein